MIHIATIPHGEQRYETVGDYWIDAAGTLQIKVSALGDWRAERLVAIHELIEQTLTQAAGITNEAIDAFDMGHPDLSDPGADPRAPYHRQHTIATGIEMLLCAELGLSWAEYDATVEAAGASNINDEITAGVTTK